MMLCPATENLRILDLGCGPGMQTRWLAHLLNVSVDAIDNYGPFLEQLKKSAEVEGISERIRAVNCDMFALNYSDSSFDVIWSEGSIFIIGFEEGLRIWKRLLTPAGFLVASHVSWLKPDAPEELKRYWTKNYPAITTIRHNLEVAAKAGYRVIGHFVLPEKSWWDNYYTPILERLPAVQAAHINDEEALKFITSEELEIEMFRKYSEYYGYVFYILQKSS